MDHWFDNDCLLLLSPVLAMSLKTDRFVVEKISRCIFFLLMLHKISERACNSNSICSVLFCFELYSHDLCLKQDYKKYQTQTYYMQCVKCVSMLSGQSQLQARFHLELVDYFSISADLPASSTLVWMDPDYARRSKLNQGREPLSGHFYQRWSDHFVFVAICNRNQGKAENHIRCIFTKGNLIRLYLYLYLK